MAKMTTEEANARALVIWRQRAEKAEAERDALREAVLDILIDRQDALPEDVRMRLRRAVGRVE